MLSIEESVAIMRVLSIHALVPLMLLFNQPAHAESALERGKELFKGCVACHSMTPDSHRTGPSLHNVFNQPAARANGFRYSKAMWEKADDGLVWTEENLHAFLINPRRFIRLNRMAYRGMEDEADRAAIIEYLKSYSE